MVVSLEYISLYRVRILRNITILIGPSFDPADDPQITGRYTCIAPPWWRSRKQGVSTCRTIIPNREPPGLVSLLN